jgi:hypothetical protein
MVAGLLAVAGLIGLSHWHSLRGVLVAASGAPLLRRLLVLHSHRRLGYSMGQPSASRVIVLMAASGGTVSLLLLRTGASTPLLGLATGISAPIICLWLERRQPMHSTLAASARS